MMTRKEIFKFFEDKEEWKFCEEDNSVIEELICFQKVLISDQDEYINIFFEFRENSEVTHRISIVHPFITGWGEIVLYNDEETFLFPRVFKLINSDTQSAKMMFLEDYLNATKKFKEQYEDVLLDYNFIPSYDGLLSFEPSDKPLNIYFNYSSDFVGPTIVFTYSFLEDTIYFDHIGYSSNDPIDLFTYSKEDFKKLFEEELRNDIRTEHLLSKDPKLTKNSYKIYLILLDHIKAYEKGIKPYDKNEEKLIDFDQIPNKWEHLYYQYIYLKEEYEKNIEKNFE